MKEDKERRNVIIIPSIECVLNSINQLNTVNVNNIKKPMLNNGRPIIRKLSVIKAMIFLIDFSIFLTPF